MATKWQVPPKRRRAGKRKNTPPYKKIHLFFACPLTFAPAQPRFIVTFFRSRYLAEECNVDIMKLLLWEALLGNWGAVGNSESDIAIEEFDPYNSHYIYEIMLSVDSVQGDLFEGTFKEMWPELLDYPFNPPA